MLFNSLDFAFFLPIVFFLYWFVFNKNLNFQNALIVISSYVFYGWWDWKFLTLIVFSTFIDFNIGIQLSKTSSKSKRKILLWGSILTNIGLLGFFKYYNFFITNFIKAFSLFGTSLEISTLQIILPVGISFYTFQTLSYTIDVYKRKLEPTQNLIAFSAFVSFFPQLVAGPIERATQLLPQFDKKRDFNYVKAVNGLKQILWGLFKKVVIADNCADFANLIFNNSSSYSGSTLALGAFFFAFQIYGDFSGYSDIAIGTARLFGFNLMQNFNFPYFSRDIAEFWRRWHISLSTWFRDYLYIPLGGSKGSSLSKIKNTFIIFLVSGFWHGANWTFIAWGFLNALYFLPLLVLNKNRKNTDTVAMEKTFPSLREIFQILFTFSITVFAWIFFRAESISHAFQYIKGIFTNELFKMPTLKESFPYSKLTFILILIFMSIEWIGRQQSFAISTIGNSWPKGIRWGFYLLLSVSILLSSGEKQSFIYFQF